MAVLAFLVTRVFNYVNLKYSGNGLLFLLVIASDNCFIKSVESKEGAEGVGCGMPPQYKGLATLAEWLEQQKWGR